MKCMDRNLFSIFSISLFLLFGSDYANAATRTWTGAGANELASNTANWSGNTVPVAGDDIVLNSGSHKDMTWNLNIPINSWTQDGYEGTVTITTEYTGSFTNLHVTGNCIINSGTWTHRGPQILETNRLSVTVGGNLTIGVDGVISAAGKGYRQGYGPGKGTGASGGTYAGAGVNGGPGYGCAVVPINIGSGANMGPGGGAIQIIVAGNSIINGSLNANGGTGASSGSGGSVLLKTKTLSGSGEIKSEGGVPNQAYMGGGGRVSVVLTAVNENFLSFTGEISAYGGLHESKRSKAGTVYLEEGNDEFGRGELIIDNLQSTVGYSGNKTSLNGLNDVVYQFKPISLKNNSVLEVNAGGTLN
ncbi:MAG: hypothetical protein GX811_05585, partial [Lentisphaerae bacterium]|nr:hypothetical protein [Lentisphaerota bacterium]